jgi:predicted nuclease of predicted toxin-antitoxin system
MKILIDMNLSPQWVEELDKYGWQARQAIRVVSGARRIGHHR